MRFIVIFTTLFAFIFIARPGFVRADMSTSVATGTIAANRSVTLATRIMGRIIDVHAEEGDPVTAGQVLVEIDDADLEAKLKVAEATKERVQAELAHRQRVKDRLTRLLKSKATSEDAIDEAEYALQVARASLKAAQAEIEAIRTTLEETRIKAPFNAVVINKYVETGHVTQAGEPLYQIQDQSRLKFRSRVKEEDLSHISVGNVVEITIPALDDDSLSATVLRVIPSGDDRHTFVVELALPIKQGLFPGMFGKAVFKK